MSPYRFDIFDILLVPQCTVLLSQLQVTCYNSGYVQWQGAKAAIQKTYYRFSPLVMRCCLFGGKCSACILFEVLFESKKQLSSRNTVFG